MKPPSEEADASSSSTASPSPSASSLTAGVAARARWWWWGDRTLAPKERLLTTLLLPPLPEVAREAEETVSCWKRKEPRLAKLLGRKLCCDEEDGKGAATAAAEACSCSVGVWGWLWMGKGEQSPITAGARARTDALK